MKYRRLLVRNFRGITEAEVSFSDGVTVVTGANEAGKSSLIEAIDLLRRYKDSSRSAAVKDVAPIGRDEAPFVELEVESGPDRLTYRKQWLRRPSTELEIRSPATSVQHFTGDEAHEQFRSFLEAATDVNLLDQINVTQGQSLDQASLAEVTALQQALGEAAAETGVDALMENLEAEYRRFFTAGGKPTGPLRTLSAQREQIAADLAAAKKRYSDAEAFTRELAENDANLQRLRARLDQDRQNLQALRAKEAQVLAQQAAIEGQEKELAAKEADLGRLRDQQQRRSELLAESASVAEQMAVAQASVAEKEKDRAELMAELERARTTEREATTQWEQAHAQREHAQTLLEIRRRENELLEVLARKQRLEEAQGALEEAERRAAESKVSDEVAQEIQSASHAAALAEVAWRTVAPSVRVTRLGAAAVTVASPESEELPLGKTHTQEVFGTMSIRVPDVVEVKVDAGRSPEKLEEALTDARAALADLLRRTGVQDAEAAQAENRVFRQREAERVRCQDILEQLRAGGDLEDLGSQATALRKAITALRPSAQQAAEASTFDQAIPADAGEGAAHSPADLLVLQDEVRVAAEAEDEKASVRDAARAEVTRVKLEGELLDQRLADLRTQARDLQSRAHTLAATRDAQRAVISDDMLDGTCLSLGREVEHLATEVERLKAEADDLERQELEDRLINASQAVEGKSARIRALEDRTLELQALLDDRTAEGLFDRVQDLEAQAQSVEEELSRVRRRADAAALLRATLVRHKEAAQRQYVQPFADGLTRLGRTVFGSDFQVQVNADLQVTTRSLGGTTVPFDSLSVGAREQLAILGRLVGAELVGAGTGAPVILDDTLGYADAERLAGLNLILNKVGRSAQIIVLTCQEERFENVGGAKVVRLPSR